jgi:UDP-N-acetylglucosamine 2-epimerase (non-hydrolysing)
MPIKVLFVFGTRPEAIKLCPLILRLRDHPGFQPGVCVTGQHRGLLDRVLAIFKVVPDYDLEVMSSSQSLASLTARILARLDPILATERPDLVYVQGDTTTTLAASLACFYHAIPVAHIEAGLRTGDLAAPFPEEFNRVLATRVAALHFAPTHGAARHLLHEGVPRQRIAVVGNTGIDALFWVRDRLASGRFTGIGGALGGSPRPLVLVTAHRRENFGPGLDAICDALLRLAARGDCEIVFPVHPNPNVRRAAITRLGEVSNIHLVEPLDYVSFVDLMRRAVLILTDSGGIQEEAPSLGLPVLVLRDKTERTEAVASGVARLVGTCPETIVREASRLLDDERARKAMTRIRSPFGDGHACRRIESVTLDFFAGSTALAPLAARSAASGAA